MMSRRGRRRPGGHSRPPGRLGGARRGAGALTKRFKFVARPGLGRTWGLSLAPRLGPTQQDVAAAAGRIIGVFESRVTIIIVT